MMKNKINVGQKSTRENVLYIEQNEYTTEYLRRSYKKDLRNKQSATQILDENKQKWRIFFKKLFNF